MNNIDELYEKLEVVRAQGNTKLESFITTQLHAQGEGDYIPGFDDGCTPYAYGGI